MKPTRLISAFLAAALSAALSLAAPMHEASAAEPPRTGGMQQFTLNNPALPVPETRFTDGAGKEMTLADFKGRVLLVNFWATWCAPCVAEMPSLDRLQAELGGKDFTVLAINEDRQGAAVATPFLEKHKIKSLAVHVDQRMALARALGVRGMPSTFLVDRTGKVVGSLTGEAHWDSPEAKALVKHYMAAE
jgi:thiol-disulfide isomerase/thioredoxin